MAAGEAPKGLDADRLAEIAIASSGLDDFGVDSWREGLERYVDSLVNEAALNDVGVTAVAKEVKHYLVNRLGIIAYRKANPRVAETDVRPPIVIVGHGRTGTTIMHDLLAQDPVSRGPLTWETERPCPPPERATYEDDPRIELVEAKFAMMGTVMPSLAGMHLMGARLGEECVCITASDFRSSLFPSLYRIPSYMRWLLDEADLAPAYRWHRCFLQHLQARLPTSRWVLKSPGHIWHLGELMAEYPGALLIQTHRDPLRTIASTASMYVTLRSVTSDAPDIKDIAQEWADYIIEGLNRSVRAREDGTVAADRIVDVLFREFMDDPFGTVGSVYDGLGLELTADAEARMRGFLAQNSQGQHGSHDYSFAATGLDEGELRERTQRYMTFFDVPSEPLD